MTTKKMIMKLNQTARNSVGKVMYTIFVKLLLQMFAGFAVVLIETKIDMLFPSAAFFINLLLGLALFEFYALLQYGFSIMLLRLVKNEYVTLGYLFYGIKKPRESLPVCALYTVLVAAIAALCSLVARRMGLGTFVIDFLKGNLNLEKETLEILAQYSVTAFIFSLTVIFSFIILLPTVFSFFIRFENKDKSFLFPFRESCKIMLKKWNYFKLIGFALRAGGRQLIITIILGIILNIFHTNESGGTSVLFFILDFLYLLNGLNALIIIYLSLPIFFMAQLNPEDEKKDGNDDGKNCAPKLLLNGQQTEDSPQTIKDTEPDL